MKIARLVSKTPKRQRLATMPNAPNAGVPAQRLAGLLVAAVLVCAPGAASAEGGDALYIDPTGQVGIGTSTPAAALDVAGTAQAQRFTGDGSALSVSGAALEAVVAELRKAIAALVPIGTIAAYGGDTRNAAIADRLFRQGWLPCDGRSVKQADYPDLYLAIGGAFGKDDRGGTFNLPDLRGRFLRGVDHGTGRDPDAGARDPSGANGNRGDNVGSVQEDAFRKHSIQAIFRQVWGDNAGPSAFHALPFSTWGPRTYDYPTDPAGGNETRPKNISANWIVKAAHPVPDPRAPGR